MLIKIETMVKRTYRIIRVVIYDANEDLYCKHIIVFSKDGRTELEIDIGEVRKRVKYFLDVSRIEYDEKLGLTKVVLR